MTASDGFQPLVMTEVRWKIIDDQFGQTVDLSLLRRGNSELRWSAVCHNQVSQPPIDRELASMEVEERIKLLRDADIRVKLNAFHSVVEVTYREILTTSFISPHPRITRAMWAVTCLNVRDTLSGHAVLYVEGIKKEEDKVARCFRKMAHIHTQDVPPGTCRVEYTDKEDLKICGASPVFSVPRHLVELMWGRIDQQSHYLLPYALFHHNCAHWAVAMLKVLGIELGLRLNPLTWQWDRETFNPQKWTLSALMTTPHNVVHRLLPVPDHPNRVTRPPDAEREADGLFEPFGAAFWTKHFGYVGSDPPLPQDIEEILDAYCPIWSGRRVRETHLLVLIPQFVGGKPLSVEALQRMAKRPKTGRYGLVMDPLQVNPPQGEESSVSSHWVLITRRLLPDSVDKTYAEQLNCLDALCRKTGQVYKVPSLIAALVCMVSEYTRTGHISIEKQVTRLQERPAEWRLACGALNGTTLGVYEDSDGRGGDRSGIAALRNLSNSSSFIPDAFGAQEWQHYLGNVGEDIPPLPVDILTLLESPCPFHEGKQVKETHMLVLIPEKINGEPLNLSVLEKVVMHSPQGRKFDLKPAEERLTNCKNSYCNLPAPPAHWVLMTREILPNSTSLSYTEQKARMDRGGEHYVCPSLLEVAICVLTQSVRQGSLHALGSARVRLEEQWGEQEVKSPLLFDLIEHKYRQHVLQVNRDAQEGLARADCGVVALRRLACPQIHSPPPAVTALPHEVFGLSQWRAYFGDVEGEEPPLPPQMAAILDAPCPLWPGKRIKQTHQCILVPARVNGQPLTLRLLQALLESPRGEIAPVYIDPKRSWKRMMKECTFSPSHSHWALVTRGPLPDSRGPSGATEEAQLRIMEKIYENTRVRYEHVTLLEAVISIAVERVKEGTSVLYPPLYGRVLDRFDNHQVLVGDGGDKGLVLSAYTRIGGMLPYDVGCLGRLSCFCDDQIADTSGVMSSFPPSVSPGSQQTKRIHKSEEQELKESFAALANAGKGRSLYAGGILPNTTDPFEQEVLRIYLVAKGLSAVLHDARTVWPKTEEVIQSQKVLHAAQQQYLAFENAEKDFQTRFDDFCNTHHFSSEDQLLVLNKILHSYDKKISAKIDPNINEKDYSYHLTTLRVVYKVLIKHTAERLFKEGLPWKDGTDALLTQLTSPQEKNRSPNYSLRQVLVVMRQNLKHELRSWNEAKRAELSTNDDAVIQSRVYKQTEINYTISSINHLQEELKKHQEEKNRLLQNLEKKKKTIDMLNEQIQEGYLPPKQVEQDLKSFRADSKETQKQLTLCETHIQDIESLLQPLQKSFAAKVDMTTEIVKLQLEQDRAHLMGTSVTLTFSDSKNRGAAAEGGLSAVGETRSALCKFPKYGATADRQGNSLASPKASVPSGIVSAPATSAAPPVPSQTFSQARTSVSSGVVRVSATSESSKAHVQKPSQDRPFATSGIASAPATSAAPPVPSQTFSQARTSVSSGVVRVSATSESSKAHVQKPSQDRPSATSGIASAPATSAAPPVPSQTFSQARTSVSSGVVSVSATSESSKAHVQTPSQVSPSVISCVVSVSATSASSPVLLPAQLRPSVLSEAGRPPAPALVSSQSAVTALSSYAFGKTLWNTHFGDVGEEPPLPSNIEAILSSSCPFWPEQQVKDTHWLVLIPQTVGGVPFTLYLLKQLVQSARGGKPAIQVDMTGSWLPALVEHGPSPAAASHWVLMPKEPLPNSTNKTYSEQCDLIDAVGSAYEVAHLLDAVTCCVLEAFRKGAALSEIKFPFMRVQEQTEGWRLIVKAFSAPKILIHYSFDSSASRDLGVLAIRKFWMGSFPSP